MSRRFSTIFLTLAIILFTVLFSTHSLFAQPLSGTKTIGGQSPDYPTINAAVTALHSNSVALGGVTFRIRGGTYNEAPDSLLSFIGTTEFSRVTFVPDDTLGVIINKTCTPSARFAFSFNNADYITFDGRHPLLPNRRLIQINALDTAFAFYALKFLNGSSYNVFRNLELSTNLRASNTSGRVIYIFPSSSFQPLSGCKVDSFINCKITGGNYGLFISGESVLLNDSLYFERNEFVNFYAYGTYINFANRSKWVANQYYRLTPSASSSIYGINYVHSSGTGSQWVGNWIYNLAASNTGSTYGIYISGGTNQLIANNMVSLEPASGGTTYGIYVSGGPANLYHNTVRVGGTAGTSSNSAACYVSGVTTDSLINNIFVNTRTSSIQTNYHIAGWFSNASPFAYSNYNLFSNTTTSSTDNQYQFRYGTTNYNTLADLLANRPEYIWDSSSVTALPVFLGNGDLHINTAQPTPVEGMGMALAQIGFDYDGDVRNPVTPDIGADEGNFIAGNDFTAPVIRHTPLTLTESDSNRIAVAYITDNMGIATGEDSPRIYFKNSTDTVWTSWNADSVRMDSVYYFHINGFPLGSTVQYYFAAKDMVGNLVTLPAGGAGLFPPGNIPPPAVFSYLIQLMVSGTKTIGATNCDFPTLTAAFDAVRTLGIGASGATFILKDTLYAEAPLTITGALNRSRQTILRPDSGLNVTIQVAGTTQEPWAIRLQRAFSVTIDGSWSGDTTGIHLTIRGSNINNAIRMVDSASWNTVRMCSLLVNSSSSASSRIVQIGGGTATNAHNIGNAVQHCILVGGNMGIYARGGTTQNVDSARIYRNLVKDFFAYGINTGYGSGLDVSNNRIFHEIPSNGSSVTGIYMETATTNSRFNANLIGPMQNTATGTQTGIRAFGSNNLISNTMITLGMYNSGTTYGINSADYASSAIICYNSVWVVGNSGNSNSTGYYNNTGGGMDTLIGNIFQNTRVGGTASNYHTGFAVNSPPSLWFCNFNIYGVPHDTIDDNFYVGVFAGYRVNTMEELMQTEWFPRDSASFREMVPFLDTLNLHISGITPTYVENGTLARADVMRDYDGQLRGTIRCDIGADEGNFLSEIVERSVPVIQGFSMDPAYPNPFNATATININIPVGANVQMKLFDVNGRVVATLVNQHLRAGAYAVRLNGNSLASGTYFVQMQAGTYQQVQKIALLK